LVKRSFLNMETVFRCDRCEHFVLDEQIIVGNKTIGIYHIFPGCRLLKDLTNDQIAHSQRLKLLLKDAIIFQEQIVLFYEESLSFNRLLDVFSAFLDAGYFVQIITL